MSNAIRTIQAFDDAWNSNDLQRVLACFSDDAEVQPVPPLPGSPERFRGKAEIRAFVEMLIPNFHVDSRDHAAADDSVTWHASVTSDTIRQMGVAALRADCSAIVENGKVRRFQPAFTPETLAELAPAQSGPGRL